MKRILILLITLICLLAGCSSKETIPTASSEYKEISLSEDYQHIIEEYRKYIDYSLNYGIESSVESDIFHLFDDNLALHWETMRIELLLINDSDNRNSYGYALKDLNGDGSLELILLLKDYTVIAVISLIDNKPHLLDAFWFRHRCRIYDSDLLYTHSSGGADYWEYKIQQISQDGSELLLVEQYGNNGSATGECYYKIVNGKEHFISESELNEALERIRIPFEATANEIAVISGLEYIPLFN